MTDHSDFKSKMTELAEMLKKFDFGILGELYSKASRIEDPIIRKGFISMILAAFSTHYDEGRLNAQESRALFETLEL